MAAAVEAQTNYTWTGASSRAWQTNTNWSPTGVPGDNAADTAMIDADPNGAQPRYGAPAGTRTIASLTLDSLSNAVPVSLEIIGDDTLTVSGTTRILADSDAANSATILLNGASMTFDPGTLELFGGDAGQTNFGEALFDFDAGTLTNPDSITMRGFSTIDAEASFTVDGDLTVDADSFATDAVVDMAASTTMTVDRIVIGDASHDVALEFQGAGVGGSASKLVTN